MKYLILGSRSFLGSSFTRYLNEKNINVLSMSSENSKNYSRITIENKIKTYKPNKIFDFRFPLVSSNDELFKQVDINQFFKNQLEFIKIINKLDEEIPDIFLISSTNIKRKKNLYTSYKKEQEDVYKKNILNKGTVKIMRLDSVLGEGDTNTNRLVPYFYKSIFTKKYVNFNINSNSIGRFSFINDINEYLYQQSSNKKINNNQFKVKYKILIHTLSTILSEKYIFNHRVDWNNKNLSSDLLSKENKYYDKLENMTDWYFKNKSKL